MKSGRTSVKQQTRDVLSKSPEETLKIGLEIGRSLSVPGVVLLRGALGTGKTTLTRGIAQGLGLEDPGLVNSPSFTLVNIYRGHCPIYHVDLYRLEGERDLYSIGMDDFLGSDGVTVIEWSERLSTKINRAVEVEIEDAGDDSRILHICMPANNWVKRSKPMKTAARSRSHVRRRLN
jgi:tRNA threonylcarbamoyladenosine biosynthesis protein TsaE